ncbi:hypothetical protein NUW54_g2068 [Trametes sanguinea]|uniref:Uncharacterized protein n=1 Tax=Trametes sanguinea TaxID=158606 RepID=A0ACC1Q8D2_9APHY|nr:hypothetical protein NUW54_g2068 [Trametes sanguinea]
MTKRKRRRRRAETAFDRKVSDTPIWQVTSPCLGPTPNLSEASQNPSQATFFPFYEAQKGDIETSIPRHPARRSNKGGNAVSYPDLNTLLSVCATVTGCAPSKHASCARRVVPRPIPIPVPASGATVRAPQTSQITTNSTIPAPIRHPAAPRRDNDAVVQDHYVTHDYHAGAEDVVSYATRPARSEVSTIQEEDENAVDDDYEEDFDDMQYLEIDDHTDQEMGIPTDSEVEELGPGAPGTRLHTSLGLPVVAHQGAAMIRDYSYRPNMPPIIQSSNSLPVPRQPHNGLPIARRAPTHPPIMSSNRAVSGPSPQTQWGDRPTPMARSFSNGSYYAGRPYVDIDHTQNDDPGRTGGADVHVHPHDHGQEFPAEPASMHDSSPAAGGIPSAEKEAAKRGRGQGTRGKGRKAASKSASREDATGPVPSAGTEDIMVEDSHSGGQSAPAVPRKGTRQSARRKK